MNEFIAALPMYDWPEARSETDAQWGRIRDALRAQGIQAPERLARRNADLPSVPGGIRDAAGKVIAPDPATLAPDEFDLHVLWRHPGLLFGQTCWGPMELGLAEKVRVVGQPDYSAYEGGDDARLPVIGNLPPPIDLRMPSPRLQRPRMVATNSIY